MINDWKALDDAEPDVTWNPLPADMLTTSGSGLDPDISLANAALQAKRVMKVAASPRAHRGAGRAICYLSEPRRFFLVQSPVRKSGKVCRGHLDVF